MIARLDCVRSTDHAESRNDPYGPRLGTIVSQKAPQAALATSKESFALDSCMLGKGEEKGGGYLM